MMGCRGESGVSMSGSRYRVGLLVPLSVGASLGVINTEYLLCARSFPCFVLFKLHTCHVSVITFCW